MWGVGKERVKPPVGGRGGGVVKVGVDMLDGLGWRRGIWGVDVAGLVEGYVSRLEDVSSFEARLMRWDTSRRSADCR